MLRQLAALSTDRLVAFCLQSAVRVGLEMGVTWNGHRRGPESVESLATRESDEQLPKSGYRVRPLRVCQILLAKAKIGTVSSPTANNIL